MVSEFCTTKSCSIITLRVGPSRKGPKANHVKQASSSHEEGSHKTSKPRPSRDIRSRSQSSHFNQERQRRDSDRQSTGDQSTGERSRHNSARGTSSDDLEFESSQEKDCSLLNGIAISEISSCSTQEGASKEQVSAPAEVAPAVAASTRCENATESPIQSSPDNNCRTVYTYSRVSTLCCFVFSCVLNVFCSTGIPSFSERP